VVADGRELWLAIHLPGYMLAALRQPAATAGAIAGEEDASVLVVDLERGGRVVRDCGARAAAAGVTPGMALNSALALQPDARVLARDPCRERALLEAVATAAFEFTPRVSLEPPDGLLLEVRGSLRLFGGVRRLRAMVGGRLRGFGLEPRLAIAATPLASLWFARSGEEVALRRADVLASRLASLPLACTRWSARSLQSLATMGVRTVGDCLRLPRDGLARRLEPRLLLDLDRALGRTPDPRAAFRAGERFATRCDLEPEIEEAARLQGALEPLIGELCAFLRLRGRGVESIDLRLLHRAAPQTRLRLRFAAPVLQPQDIAGLLHERLARVALPAPVRQVWLRSGPLVEVRAEPADLFALERERGAGVPRLIERLRARLGTQAVHGIRLVPGHRPESAWEIGDILLFRGEARNSLFFPSREKRDCSVLPPGKGECPQFPPQFPDAPSRPLWLLAEPLLLEGVERPRYQDWLELEEGPERIESGWWDGRDVRRDYYVARSPAGARRGV
jgi:protein ImuB